MLWRLGLALALAAGGAQAAPVDAYPDVARAYRVEVDGEPLWAGHDRQRLPMASLTKLMTALLVAERGEFDAWVTVSATAVAETGSRLGLRRGEQVRAGDLFTAMLVRSANDACRALADWQGGDQARFVAAMNARAAALGLGDTRFADACGHDHPQQYSTASDLARLARAVLSQPRIVEAVAMKGFVLRTAGGREIRMGATNALLDLVPGVRGLKTGYTPGAGRCLIALAERDGREVLAVLLHAPDRWWDAAGLIELAFAEAQRRP